jgi:hypothetical protein
MRGAYIIFSNSNFADNLETQAIFSAKDAVNFDWLMKINAPDLGAEK